MREFMNLVEQHARYFGGFAYQPEHRLVSHYMRGWCPYFALALHDIFGWELIHTGAHIACKRPDGKFVDVRGVMTPEEFKNGLNFDPYLETDKMARAEIIADMDGAFSFKCGFFRDAELKKAKRLVKSLLPMPIMESADGITFENDHLGSGYGQHDYILRLKAHGEQKGWVTYSVFDGTPSIKMLEVADRRKGYATRLMLELQTLFPDREIELGMQTEEGAALIASLPTTVVVDSEMKASFERLAALHARDTELQRRAEAHEPLGLSSPDEWNDIHDEIWKLEEHTRGQTGEMRLFTAY